MEYLALTVLAPNQNTLINELIQLAAKNQCNIHESRLVLLGSEFAGVLLVAGNWSAIAKLETALNVLKNKPDITLQIKRTEPPKLTNNLLPYLIQVVALENSELVYDISSFFTLQNIYITDLQTNAFKANYAGTSMITLMMSISIPSEINIADLRERFILLCDELNVDGIMEPEKR